MIHDTLQTPACAASFSEGDTSVINCVWRRLALSSNGKGMHITLHTVTLVAPIWCARGFLLHIWHDGYCMGSLGQFITQCTFTPFSAVPVYMFWCVS